MRRIDDADEFIRLTAVAEKARHDVADVLIEQGHPVLAARVLLTAIRFYLGGARAVGYARSRATGGDVRLSWKILRANGFPEDEVRETTIHELAHVLTPGHHHDNVWRELYIALGGNGSRTHSMSRGSSRIRGYCPACDSYLHGGTRRDVRDIRSGEYVFFHRCPENRARDLNGESKLAVEPVAYTIAKRKLKTLVQERCEAVCEARLRKTVSSEQEYRDLLWRARYANVDNLEGRKG